MIEKTDKFWLPALFLLLFAATAAPRIAIGDAVTEAINQRMEDLLFTGDLEIEGIQIAARNLLPGFYASREFQPAWTSDDRVRELLKLIEQAPDQGLEVEDYFPATLRALLDEQVNTGSAFVTADLDILLTESLIRFGYNQRFGKVRANSFDTNINFKRELLPGRDIIRTIQRAIDSDSLERQFEEMNPRGPIYRGIQQVLEEYRTIAAAGGWQNISDGPAMREGDRDVRVTAVRQRLAITGDLPVTADRSADLFDETLQQAVMAFQSRHALDADGVIGRQSLAAMNVPVEKRVDQLRLSLERLRWVSQEIVEKFVAVNIAGFKLYVARGQEIIWTTRVQVGKAYRQTPIFRGNIRYLELNPTWTVPPGILANDVLPAIRRDPGYLAAKNMSVIDRDGQIVDPATIDWSLYKTRAPYTFRQEPGPNNALGQIKFIWPNEHFVFLHDTSSRSLFSRAERSFSSGCIRVEDPMALAELVLDQPKEWNIESLEEIVATKKTRRLYLDKTMPVLILYLTAMLEPDGDIRFLKDIYNRDEKLLEALNADVAIDLTTT